jgi:hypothetical protein
MKSPFVYGHIVSNKEFADREDERKKLAINMLSGINTMIISPRRWGKSSMVTKVFEELSKENKNVKVLILDFFSANSEEEFLQMFATEIIRASSSKWEDWVRSGKEMFTSFTPRVTFGIDPISDFNISFSLGELKKNKREILNLPEVIAKKKKFNFVIGLDEFQNIANFSDYKNLEKNMRAVWQKQKHVTYCIYGSKRHMMKEIFDNSSNPFYRFGDIIYLQKITTDKWIKFIQSGFRRTKKKIDKPNAQLIVDLMKNHSWYIQQLSHYVWNLTSEVVTKREIKLALEEVISANTPLYQQAIEQISFTQINLLKAITNNEKQLSSMELLQKYNLGTSRNVSKNKTILLSKDVINKVGERFEFLDPAFELWFKRQFFHIPILQSVNLYMK